MAKIRRTISETKYADKIFFILLKILTIISFSSLKTNFCLDVIKFIVSRYIDWYKYINFLLILIIKYKEIFMYLR